MITADFIRPGSVNGIRSLVKQDLHQFAPLPENYQLVETPFGIVGAINLDTHTSTNLSWFQIPENAFITIDLRLNELLQ